MPSSNFYHNCNIFVPKTKLNNNLNHSLPGSNYDLRNLIKEKKLAHNKYKISNQHSHYLHFSNLSKKYKQLFQPIHLNCIIRIENNINTKSFWNYIQS